MPCWAAHGLNAYTTTTCVIVNMTTIIVFTLCRWTRNFKTQPARERGLLGPYLQRMLERPALQRVFVAEQLAAPWV